MSAVLNGNKTEISLIDESFSHADTGRYSFLALLSPGAVQVSAHCSLENRFLTLISRQLKEPGLESSVHLLGRLGEEFPWMKERFRKRIITWLDGNFTLVPSGLFSSGEAASFLHLSCANGTEGDIAHRPFHRMDAVIAWKKPHFLDRHDTDYIHQAYVTIEGLTAMNKNQPGQKVYAMTHNGTLELCILNAGALQLYNIFRYENTDELVYYVMNAYESLGLNPEVTPLVISGCTEKNSAAWMLFYRYIRHVDLVNMPGHYSFSYKINNEGPGRFFSLFSQMECAS